MCSGRCLAHSEPGVKTCLVLAGGQEEVTASTVELVVAVGPRTRLCFGLRNLFAEV